MPGPTLTHLMTGQLKKEWLPAVRRRTIAKDLLEIGPSFELGW